jgi:UPF0176 protein
MSANNESASTNHDTTSTSSTVNDTTFRILALYKFVSPKFSQESLSTLKETLESHCRDHHVRGSLLLAPEGMNGTISYPHPEDDDPVLSFFEAQFPNLQTRISTSLGHVFYRLKIKIKSEILTCRSIQPVCLDPTVQKGIYVPPGPEWNALLTDPDCLVVDARNDYEVRLGTFANAHNPQTTTFSELLPWMHQQLSRASNPKKVAMFCTGGIRCEKATAACLHLVQQQQVPVYHLQGGILAYLDTVPVDQSLWQGSCYVFDQRVAVTHGLVPDTNITMRHACRSPLQPEEQEGHLDFIRGLQCRYCKTVATAKSRQRATARQYQIGLCQQKNLLHIHDPKEKVLRVLAGKQNEEHPPQKTKVPENGN